jgi:hypothetical protein
LLCVCMCFLRYLSAGCDERLKIRFSRQLINYPVGRSSLECRNSEQNDGIHVEREILI